MTDTCFIVRNTERGWAEEGWRIMHSKESSITVVTHLENRTAQKSAGGSGQDSASEREPSDVILNLQYFFPYCDQYLRQDANRRITLIVICQTVDDRSRVCCYLQGQEACHTGLHLYAPVESGGREITEERLKAYTGEENKLASQTIGALCALLRVGEPLENGARQPVCRALPYGRLADVGNYYTQVIDAMTNGRSVPELEGGEQDVQLRLLLEAGKEELLKIPQELSGTQQDRMDPKKKEQLCGQLWEYIRPTLQRLPLLTQVIWVYSLRYLNKQKELMTIKGDSTVFHKGPIDFSLWAAIAYGEGILQLLENCAQHSRHKAGYFTLYFHYVALHQNRDIVEAAGRREQLTRRYRVSTNESFLGDDEKFYLEFNITDMAMEEDGSVKGITLQSKKSLDKLFWGEEVTIRSKDVIIHHYGMPLFHKTVCMNQGRFLCSTPIEHGQVACYSSAEKSPKQKTIPGEQGWTSYRILLPVTYRKNNELPAAPAPKARPLLDPSFLKNDVPPSRYAHHPLDRRDFQKRRREEARQEKTGQPDRAGEKIARVKEVEHWLKEEIIQEEADKSVYLLDMRGLDLAAFEIFTKGLFSCFADFADQGRSWRPPLLFRILFRDEFSLCEFLRRAAIIYGSFGQNEWMGCVQLALCVMPDSGAAGVDAAQADPGQPMETGRIRLILAGTGLKAAYNTAKLFVQYDRSNAHNLISQIRYLTRTIEGRESSRIAEEEGAQPQFPFDLVRQGNADSQFLEQMGQCLNRDLQGEELGCKLSNAHIRIGSKFHLKDFYEAELLFQNIGCTYRFAYLIAEDIVQQLNAAEPGCSELVLVGYENYSSVLVSQVIDYLDKARLSKRPALYHLQYLRKNSGEEYLNELYGPFNAKKACSSIFILPVGTTLSTIYKLQNTLTRSYPEVRFTAMRSYAVIVVNDSSERSKSAGYWKRVRDERHPSDLLLRLEPEKRGGAPLSVRTFLMTSTEWMVPTRCPECMLEPRTPRTHVPLGQVDKTSTIPNLIFPLKRKGTKGITFSIKDKKENHWRLEGMRKYVTYGHVLQSHNHFQFYIEYSSYYAEARKQPSYKNWLDSLRREVDMNSFNIVISPRSYNDCLFVKDVVDEIFLHNPYFLFLPLDTVYREDIRAKFSYITEEYAAACAGDFPPKVNIYFVDYTLISGQTLHRGANLVNMLLRDSRVGARDNIDLYHKIILLANRSSYDTIGYMVRDPLKDFHAYVTLAIPTFNTQQNYCPTCEMVELYRETAKCCATNDLYWYYRNLEQKHMLRAPEEYEAWSRRTHGGRPNYLRCLCQWLYSEPGQASAAEDLDSAMARWEKTQTGEESLRLERVWDLCLDDLYEAGHNRTEVDQAMAALLEERTWRRMICTHKAMQIQEELAAEGWPDRAIYNRLRAHLYGELSGLKGRFLQREWLISYLKVFSRGYLGKLSQVRQGIYTLLELLLQELIQPEHGKTGGGLDECWNEFGGTAKENEAWRALLCRLLRVGEKLGPEELLQLYQMYLVIARRLCDLQSSSLLTYEILQGIDGFLNRLLAAMEKLDGREGLARFITLPSRRQMRVDYMRLVKWCAMSSAEESKGFQMQELAERLTKEGNGDEKASILDCRALADIIRMENTRLIYTGVKRLDQICPRREDWADTVQQVREVKELCTAEHGEGESGLGKYYPQNPLSDLFRFMDGIFPPEADYTNRLAAMLKLYRQIQKIRDGSGLESRKNYMELYGELCFYMSQIADYQNCCVVHRRGGQNQIIARSIALTPNDDTASGVECIIEKAVETRRGEGSGEFRGMDESGGESHDLVVTLHLQRRSGEKYKQIVYLVFWNWPEASGRPDEKGKSMLLFMRQPLQELLERDLYALHHFKVSYEDVVRIAPEAEELCILHLTDLHISVQNVKSVLQLVEDWKAELAEGSPDLLLITGDIVQGNNTAIDLEQNYRQAGKVIKAIAQALWSEKRLDRQMVLRTDWKKRIIIIPGNHDYAAMNELTATHTLRATNGGTPVMKDGSPMSRFSYLIQFLQDFLELDVSQSVQDNLNEVRTYPQLGIRIIALNSVAQVGPLRNNKMQLDSNFIEKLGGSERRSRGQPDAVNIVLSHHTACYRPNYIADQYYESGISEEQITQARCCIEKCSELRNELERAENMGEDKIKECLKRGKEVMTVLREKEGFKSLERKHGRSALYSDIDYLMRNWSILTNERCQQIIADYHRHMLMSKRDRAEYLRQINKLQTVYPFRIMLGGHTHAAGRVDWGPDGMKSLCVEGPKFYDESADPAVIWFGRLKIKSKEEYTYTFSRERECRSLEAPEWAGDKEKAGEK